MEDQDFRDVADYLAAPTRSLKKSPNLQALITQIRRRYPIRLQNTFGRFCDALRLYAAQFGQKLPDDPGAANYDVQQILSAIPRNEKRDFVAPLLKVWWCDYPDEARSYLEGAIGKIEESGVPTPTHLKSLSRSASISDRAEEKERPTTEPVLVAIRATLEEIRAGPGPVIPMGWPLADGAVPIGPDKGTVVGPVKFPHPEGLCCAAFSPEGRFIVTGGAARTDGSGVYVWQAGGVASDDRRLMVAHHDEDVAYVACSPDGTRVAAAFEETAGIFHAGSKQPRIHLLQHETQITTIAYSVDGEMVATSSWDGTARIWDAHTGKRIWKLVPMVRTGKVDDHLVNSVSFSSDNSQVVLACSSGAVSGWDTRTGKRLWEIPDAHEDRFGASSAAFSADNRLVVTSGCADYLVRLWDIETRTLYGSMGDEPLHSNDLLSAQFSPDSTRLVTASKDGWSFVWNIEKKAVEARLKHPNFVYTAEFSPDGRHVLTACEDGSAYLWRVA